MDVYVISHCTKHTYFQLSFLGDFKSLSASGVLEYRGINIGVTKTIIHTHIWLEYWIFSVSILNILKSHF